MNDTLETTISDALVTDFDQARSELVRARQELSRKDSSAHRDAVAGCLERLDAILDMRLAVPAH